MQWSLIYILVCFWWARLVIHFQHLLSYGYVGLSFAEVVFKGIRQGFVSLVVEKYTVAQSNYIFEFHNHEITEEFA